MSDIMFNSHTYGRLTFSEVIDRISIYMHENTSASYSFILGTDSNGNGSKKKVNYITAILVHRVGFGGIYFWHKEQDKQKSLFERIFKEAALSLDFAERFLAKLKEKNVENFSFEIHVDVGQNGKTRDIINQVIGMIQGSGHKVVAKPDSYVASKVADRHTK